jgi:NarL family two-component system response regulator LiaR
MQAESDRRISVLIVEDSPIYREALEGNLRARKDRISVLGWADHRDMAISLVEEYVPDVVLLDLVLFRDHRAGIEVIYEVKRISPTTKIVVLTAYFDDNLIFEAIRAGAITYLLKDNVSGDELVDILARVRDGNPPIDPMIARRLYDFFQSPNDGTGQTSDVSKLTEREMEVLMLVAESKRNREIAEALFITEKTVKTHVSNILSKLHLSNRTELKWWYERQHLAPNRGPKPT